MAKTQQLKAVFLLLDTDRDGLLNWEEVKHGARLLGIVVGKEPRDPEEAPPQGPRRYAFQEFADTIAQKIHRDHNTVDDLDYKVKRLFMAMDRYGTGSVSEDDICAFFRACGDDFGQELVRALMDRLDCSLDGNKVTLAELRAFLRAASPPRGSQPWRPPVPPRPFAMYGGLLRAHLDDRLAAAEGSQRGGGAAEEGHGEGAAAGSPQPKRRAEPASAAPSAESRRPNLLDELFDLSDTSSDGGDSFQAADGQDGLLPDAAESVFHAIASRSIGQRSEPEAPEDSSEDEGNGSDEA
mmetsp:Transcript_24119/g.57451  ORF Transcript_24119/g.57451 Transcript_24119/m.57451 type:complete len:296 (-) Transcript_24119:198-1085(-)